MQVNISNNKDLDHRLAILDDKCRPIICPPILCALSLAQNVYIFLDFVPELMGATRGLRTLKFEKAKQLRRWLVKLIARATLKRYSKLFN